MNKSRVVVAAIAVLVVGALAAAFAQAQVVQQGAVRVSVSAKIAPQRLPRHGKDPISVHFAGHISATKDGEPPNLTSLRIALNRNGVLDTRGLPTCNVAKIGTASSNRALTICRKALVGQGKFTADTYLAGGEPYPAVGRLLLFNGVLHGRPAVFGHIYSAQPFATSFIIPFTVRESAHGRYGTELTADFPQSLSSWGNVTGIEMKLSRRYSYRGERHSFLSAGCPAPKGFSGAVYPLAQASFGFAVGPSITVDQTGVCKATGK